MTSLTPRPRRAFGCFGRLSGALVVSAAGALGYSGCAGGQYTSTSAERSPEAYKPLTTPVAQLGFRWDWSAFPAPNPGEGVLFLEAYPDIVVTQDSASKVCVIEAGSGRVRWSNEVANRATKFVGIVRDKDASRGDRLIVSSEAEAFILDTQTGNVVGRQRFEKVVNTRPTLVGPVGWYGTPNGEMLGHLFSRNVKFNSYQMPGAIEQPLVQIGGVIGGITQAGEVAFIDAGSGTLVGRTKIYGGSTSELATADGLMYVASLDQSLYAFNTAGQTVWRKRTSKPIVSHPTAVGQTVYCTTEDAGFTAFDAATGKERWTNPAVRGAVIGVRNKRVMVWDGKTMSLVDAGNGGTIERADLPGVLRFSLDKFEDGNLYAVNRGGVVGKFIPR